MSSNYHTPITSGAAANASTFNSPLGELDAQMAAFHGGSGVSAETLIAWTEGEAYEVTSATFDGDNVLETATVQWPDGSAGTLTRTSKNTTWLAVDAYTITHVDSGKTVTQAAVTRDSNGNITTKPALTVA